MEWDDLTRALALVMVIEGLLPFAAPARWRTAMLSATQASDRVLRGVGFASMLAGVALLQFV